MGMHHGNEPMQNEGREKMARLLLEKDKENIKENLAETFDKLDKIHGLGPTGKFPEGKIQPDDDGEIRFSLGLSTDKKKVMINFGKPVRWVGMDRNQALDVAKAIIKAAKGIKL